MSDSNSSQLTKVSTVLNFSTETIPFFPDDVTSMFGPLVGDRECSGIVFQQASGCPVGGRGFEQNRRCNRIRESHALNGGGYSSWAGIKRGSQGPHGLWNRSNKFSALSFDRALRLPVPEEFLHWIYFSLKFVGQRSILFGSP